MVRKLQAAVATSFLEERPLRPSTLGGLPLEFAHALVKDPLLPIEAHHAIFERALPLVLHALHLIVRAEDVVSELLIVVINGTGSIFVWVVKIRVDCVFIVFILDSRLLVLVVYITIELWDGWARGCCRALCWASSLTLLAQSTVRLLVQRYHQAALQV